MKHPLINKEKRQSKLLLKISGVGIILAAFLVLIKSVGKNIFCDLSGFICSTENGISTTVAGIPLASTALVAFITIFILTAHIYSKSHIKGHFGKRIASTLLVIVLFFATLFSLYLVLIQFIILSAFCLLCLLLAAIIIAAFWVSILLFMEIVR